MRQIKNFFSALILGVITVIFLTYLTVENDHKHAENCKTLGIECEKGKVETLRNQIMEEGKKLIKELQQKF